MKKILFLFLLIPVCVLAQIKTGAYKDGEFLKFRINYGLLNAGFASLEIKKHNFDGKPEYYVIGDGYTTGMVNLFFPVKDDYQTYFNPKTLEPRRFIRNISEGGYKKNKEIFFDIPNKKAKVFNYKHNWEKSFSTPQEVQDMLSSLYYLRSLNFDTLKVGDSIILNVFYDEENNKIKLVFKGREVINTKWGKVKTVIFSPMVETGRVFKNEESVTLWMSDDKNKIPIKIKAAILVGSLKAELIEYNGLANPFPIIFN
jgi:hypothetical protein